MDMKNLGYACINMQLSYPTKWGNQPRGTKPITTNRSMIKRTFQERGLPYASELALQNCRDLIKVLKWNHANDIHFFRVSSDLFPWASEYELNALPDYEDICEALQEAGNFAYDNDHRITTHPGPFNVLGSPKQHVVDNTIKELNTHAEVFDLMGLPTTPYAKINIHVGGTYGGDFAGTAKRWCTNFHRLSETAQARITVENDDKASMWSTQYLYDYIHKEILIPIVHDVHHHKFCTGGLTDKEAMSLAASTWFDVKPVIHYSQDRRIEYNDPKNSCTSSLRFILDPC
jgi:UV DNA damage endonuclease